MPLAGGCMAPPLIARDAAPLPAHARHTHDWLHLLPAAALRCCRFERLKETAFEYAFLLKTAGMLDSKPLPGSGSTCAAKL